MSNAEERLVVMLEGRVTEFEKRMRQAEQRGTQTYQGLRRNSRSATRAMEADMNRATSSINRALATTGSKIGGFAKAFAGGAAIGAAGIITAGLQANITETVKGIASLGDEAKRSGLGLEVFQEWKFVAEQNRIGVDSLVDGFKELSLRADEFITTGAGPAAEAFRRIGYTGKGLTDALKDPSELMKEIIDRMQSLDKAAQIRVADELFGGTAGERFVELLDQGRAGIEATIQRAHEAGAVLDSELVAKAAELDKRFNELQTTVGNFFKRVSVGAAGAIAELTDFRAKMEVLFPDEAQGRAVLGDELYDSLAQNRDILDANVVAVEQLDQEYQILANDTASFANMLREAAANLYALGETGAADEVERLAREMEAAIASFRDGETSGEDLVVKLGEIQTSASDAFDALANADSIGFGNVIDRLAGLGATISAVAAQARDLTRALAAAAGVDAGTKQGEAMRTRQDAEAASMASLDNMRRANDDFLASEQARNDASAEQLQLQREIEATRKRAAEAGATLTGAEIAAAAQASLAGDAARSAAGQSGASGGGGGGSSRGGGGRGASPRQSDFAREVERIREQTAALEAEAASLIATAQSGKEYGDALEYARTRAELLHKAQQDGQAITPELRAEIDGLAEAYVTAGLNAEEAADRLQQIQDQSERGRQALEDMFGSILDGSMSAKDAVIQLLAEIAKVQLMKGIMGLPGMGGLASAIGGALVPGFASGGDHRGGLRIVGERGPELEATGPSRIWNPEQTQRMLGREAQSPGPRAADRIGGKAELVIQAPPGFTSEQIGEIQGISVKVVESSAPHLIRRSVAAAQKSRQQSKLRWE